MKISVVDARTGKKQLAELDLQAPSLTDLKKAYHQQKRVDPSRQAFYYVDATTGQRGKMIVAAENNGPVADLKDGSVVMFKDLGPQIAWRTVFLTEYFGPILTFPLAYFLAPYIHGEPVQLNNTQMYVFIFIPMMILN